MRTYDCPICSEPCRPEKQLAYVANQQPDEITIQVFGVPAVVFQCALGHRFYVNEWDIENPGE